MEKSGLSNGQCDAYLTQAPPQELNTSLSCCHSGGAAVSPSGHPVWDLRSVRIRLAHGMPECRQTPVRHSKAVSMAPLLVHHLDITSSLHHDSSVRTTLTLDEDVADFLTMQSRLQGRSFQQVVNDVLRRGMAPNPQDSELPKFRVVPNHSGLVPSVDPLKLNQLNDALEVDDFVAEGRR